MKTFAVILLCLMSSLMAFAQLDVELDEVEVTPPKFTGIENATVVLKTDNTHLMNYLANSMQYPGMTDPFLHEGTEVIQFVVTPKGNLTDFKVINSVSREIDDEMIRVLRTTDGMWKPGYNNGEPVAMEKEVAVMFGDYRPEEIIGHFTQVATSRFNQANKFLLIRDKPKRAVRLYSQGIRYLPNDKGLRFMRGICYAGIGDIEKAEQDWNRMAGDEEIDISKYAPGLTELKGYAEFERFLAMKKE